ncbi:MAG: hypothetical protein UY52_C0004G0002 [Parcubacteria group bacterium GW2011_GWC2_49_9]|nr:MAG: hypothetical protein UY52_C0004G0002 [Parcubacteria group bacterium GW2011_GWC2_49_9]
MSAYIQLSGTVVHGDGLAHAGDFPPQRQPAKAQAAKIKLPQEPPRTPAPRAAIPLPDASSTS